MTEPFTPTTKNVRHAFSSDPEAEYRNPVDYPQESRELGRAFDRWLCRHEAEVAAAALEDASRRLLAADGDMFDQVAGWLALRANLTRVAKRPLPEPQDLHRG